MDLNNVEISPVILWGELVRVYELIKKAQTKNILDNKLTIPQFNVLQILAFKGSIPLKNISNLLYVTGANITCIINNLEKEKLVKRVPSKTDRRVVLAEITPEGQELINKVYPIYVKNIEGSISDLSTIERNKLIKILGKIA